MKSIVLCADDYAQNRGVSLGIRKLIDLGRLSAVSAFSITSHWEREAEELATCSGIFDVGLHFSLTHEGKSPVQDWLLRSLAGTINPGEIEDQLVLQWSEFCRVWGRPPDYLDGHEHVHAFPGIAEVVEKTLKRIGVSDSFLIRRVNRPVMDRAGWLKAVIVAGLARKSYSGEKFPGNPWFAGFYPFRGNYSAHLRHWVASSPDGTLIMCHPGMKDVDEKRDPIANARENEFHALAGLDFGTMMTSSGAVLRKFTELNDVC